MKPQGHLVHLLFPPWIGSNGRPLCLGVPAVLLAFLCGCASEKPVGVTQGEVPALSGSVMLDPGAIAVTSPGVPAAFGFDRAMGKSGYAGDGAGSLARKCLDPPTPPIPEMDLLLSPVGLVLSPFAAAYGAVATGRARLTTNRLSESEANLARVMAVMADQKELRDPLLQAAAGLTRRPLVPVDFTLRSAPNCGPVSAVLETRIEELRLERTTPSDTSFVLRIKARARLYQASDGTVLCDVPYEYRSQSALFLDWTCPKVFRGAAETGYRDLAKTIAARLLSSAPEGPTLVGAGYRHSPRLPPAASTVYATYKNPPQPDRLMRVSYAVDEPIVPGFYSGTTLPPIAVQRPLTKDEAVSEAVKDTDRALDRLQDSRNIVVQVTACAAAIPISLWKQTVGAVRGVRAEKLQFADQQLSAVLREAKPQVDLVEQVAVRLTPQQASPALLAMNLSTPGSRRVSTGMPPVTGQSFADRDGATVLEIHVQSAGLKGNGTINPSLAFCFDAQATLFRARDRVELHSCPVRYRGEARKFTQWAAHDARLLRQELQRCYRDVSTSIVDQLAARGFLAPSLASESTLAKN